jgi:hypothetical protein
MPRRPDPKAIDLERAIDHLFRIPPGDFVAARNDLAADLRAGGRAAEALRVRGLAKASVTAWAVNQVWWTDRALFERMLRAGERLRDAQAASLRGRNADVRGAAEARQAAIDDVVDLALRAVGGASQASPAIRQRIAATCDALAAGSVEDDVTPGRLTRDLQPSGMGALSAFLAPGGHAPSGRPRTPDSREPAPVRPFRRPSPAEQPPRGAPAGQASAPRNLGRADHAAGEAAARAQAATSAAETAYRAAEDTLGERQAQLRQAEEGLEAAMARVSELERLVVGAYESRAEAQLAVRQARDAVASAEADRTRTERALAEARARLKPFAG